MSIVAVNSNYTYLGLCSTISKCKPGDPYTYLIETSTGAGVYPNNSKSFGNAGHAKCIETNPFDLEVKDSVTGLLHTLTATAVQGAPNQTCPV